METPQPIGGQRAPARDEALGVSAQAVEAQVVRPGDSSLHSIVYYNILSCYTLVYIYIYIYIYIIMCVLS